jgi:hypothetical protein
MEDGLIEGTADGVSEGTIDGKSDGKAAGSSASTAPSAVATVLVDRGVDTIFLLSLEFFVGMKTRHNTVTVIAMIAIYFFVVQAIVPFCVPSVFSINKL